MRLELNLPALERLIGGDTELELHLRTTIVQEFSKRHLKEVVNQDIFDSVLRELRCHINSLVKDNFGINGIVNTFIYPDIDKKVKTMIESLIEEHTKNVLNDVLIKLIDNEQEHWQTYIKHAIEQQFNRQIELEVRKGVRERLDQFSLMLNDERSKM